MSNNILKMQPEVSLTGGYLWIPEGEKKILSPNDLRSGVLCKRHNEMLSPLDSCGGKVFSFLRNLNETHSSSKAITKIVGVNGYDFQRFILQRFCAFYYSNNISINRQKTVDFSLDSDFVIQALLHNQWPKTSKFFLTQTYMENSIPNGWVFTPLFCNITKKVSGCVLYFYGIEFVLIFDETRSIFPYEHDGFIPRGLNFEDINSFSTLIFHWPMNHGPLMDYKIYHPLLNKEIFKRKRRSAQLKF